MKKTSLNLIAALLASTALLPLAGAAIGGKSVPAASVAGEKLDSGLGDLPHYRDWKDKTGKDPMGRSMQYAQKQ